MEWNDPADIALVSRTFDEWAAAVIAKDRPAVETFHDNGFRVRLGKGLLDKNEHNDLELAVASSRLEARLRYGRQRSASSATSAGAGRRSRR